MGGREVTRGAAGKRPGPARGSRPETETNGFAGSRARTVPAAGPPPPKFPVQGSRPKTETNGFAGSRARTVPAAGLPTSKLPARGSRPETETNGFAGSRARTVPAAGPPPPNFPARGSRLKTEIKGFARSQARTMPGPPRQTSPVGPAIYPVPLSAAPAPGFSALAATNKLYCITIYTA